MADTEARCGNCVYFEPYPETKQPLNINDDGTVSVVTGLLAIIATIDIKAGFTGQIGKCTAWETHSTGDNNPVDWVESNNSDYWTDNRFGMYECNFVHTDTRKPYFTPKPASPVTV